MNATKFFRLFFILLAFFGLSVNSAFAQFGGGNGSVVTPYQISTVTHLAQLATNVSDGNDYSGKYFVLTSDLDLNVAPYNSGKGWIPIGKIIINMFDDMTLIFFKGNFNGNGKKITNLFIDDGTLAGAGLFGVVTDGVIENLGVENVNIKGLYMVGGVAGGVANASITNCYSTGNVSGAHWVGGVAGSIPEDASITNCYFTGNVSGKENVGGVAGYVDNNSFIKDSHSTGNVSGTGDHVGGVAGEVKSHSSITNCYSTGNVSGTSDYVGGVTGYVDNNCSITNCYSEGEVSGKNGVGGVAGSVDFNSFIKDSHSTGNVSGTSDYVGGVAGSVYDNSSISNCYSTGNVSGDEGVGGIAGRLNNNCKIENCAALNPGVKGNTAAGRIVGYFVGTLANNIAFDGILNNDNTTAWSNIGLTAKDGEDMTKATINSNGTLGGRFTSSAWTTQTGSLPGLFGKTVVMPEHLRISGMIYITTASLPDGFLNTPYTATLTADGDTPVTWSIIANALPLGLTLDPNTGVISGTPATKGTFTFTVKVANSAGNDSKKLSIVINDGAGIKTITNDELRMMVYPNQTSGQLIINNEQLIIKNVEIYSVVGQKLNDYQMSNVNYQLIIDVSHLPNGIYFLKAGNNTVKFVKE